MFDKTDEVKVLRDPIHGYIHVYYQVIWDCINTREFQRLHRIHQLGGVFQVYHTAEHSRFSHSLGVYEIVRRMITEVDSISDNLNDSEKIQVMCAALLHDLGHGPFSHFFETISHKSHEDVTCEIILDQNSQIHQALIKTDPTLPVNIVKILKHEHPKQILHQMISSQLDADRMDYLLRDAYETGTSYGTFDLERILRTLRVHDDTLCIKESGMHSVEDYIMARYHMYWQVYLHPDSKSYEIMIHQFFKRYSKLRDMDIFEPLYVDHLLPDDFYKMDEMWMFYGFMQATDHSDPILSDLATRILDRKLFDWQEDKNPRPIIQKIIDHGLDPDYYFYEEFSSSKAYLPYSEDKETIWILRHDDTLVSLSNCSEIVKALLKMETHTNDRIYFPKDIRK